MGAGRIDEACTSNADCAESELCATGLCEGGLGECVPRPETCRDNVSPVCGCDGFSYQNRCFAEQAGIRLATATACTCTNDSSCVEGQFCGSDTSCLQPGFCTQPPASCDEEISEPVCGCDGNDYNNACEAAQAGVRVSAEGMCECQTNEDCDPSTEYCNAAVCDGPGVCDLRNDPACMPEGPVTDCDGVVYENACVAAEQGVRVRPE